MALQVHTDRSCQRVGGPLPASHASGAERLTCSPRCTRLRHNRLRHNRLQEAKEGPEMKALQLAKVLTDVAAETRLRCPDHPSRRLMARGRYQKPGCSRRW